MHLSALKKKKKGFKYKGIVFPKIISPIIYSLLWPQMMFFLFQIAQKEMFSRMSKLLYGLLNQASGRAIVKYQSS